MKKAHRTVYLLSIYCVCFLYASVALANPRLDRIQKTYIEEIDSFISREITSSLNKYEKIALQRGETHLLDLEERISKLEQALLEVSETLSTPANFQAALNEEKRLRGLLDQINDSEKNFHNIQSRMKGSLSGFGSEELCKTAIRAIHIAHVPRYDLDENIDLSQIPEFKQKRVRAAVGSEIESADVIEKGLYLPATTRGCVAGQAILFFLPEIGCIIGAVVGGGAAYAAGKISTAFITESENRNEQSAYEQIVAKERVRQEQEIAEAKLWMLEHPIHDESIRERAKEVCSKQNVSSKEKVTQEAESLVNKLTTARIAAEKYMREFEAHRNQLRTQVLQQREKENSHLVTALINKLSLANVAEERLTKLKVTLADCLIDASDSCGSMFGCVNEAQNEYDNLPVKDEKDFITGSAEIAAELRKLNTELLLCEDV